MIRSAAKNHERVAVVVDPADYAARARGDRRRRRDLATPRASGCARKAFAHTAAYDGAIASHLGRFDGARRAAGRLPGVAARRAARWRARCATARTRTRRRRSTRSTGARRPVAGARARCCRARSCPTTTCSIWTRRCGICAEFAGAGGGDRQAQQPVRRGRRRSKGVADAYRRARETDPVSAFGGIVAVNRPVDGELAREIKRDVPRVRDRAGVRARGAAVLAASKNLRLLVVRHRARGRRARSSCAASRAGSWCRRAIATPPRRRPAKVVSKRPPTPDELRDLDFAWRVCQAREVERDRVRRRRPHAGHRRRPDVARRFGAHRGVEGARAAGRVGARVGRVLPVPRRRRRGGQGGRRRRHPAGRLGARRRSRSPPPTSTAWRWS